MNTLIPVYNADGSLFAWASDERLARLQSAGLVARVVRSRNGQVKRATLFLQPGEPKPVGGVVGTRYSFREGLNHGLRCWKLKSIDARPAFFQVLRDCGSARPVGRVGREKAAG